jgi:ATP-binding cassette subfamily F protein uup
VETPGGWQDFVAQNPGFFARPPIATAAAKAPQPKAQPSRAAKLSYKDQRRLSELETLIAEAPAKTAALEAKLADPGLYGRDAEGFRKLSGDLDELRAQLAAAEEEWLALEERREALESTR